MLLTIKNGGHWGDMSNRAKKRYGRWRAYIGHKGKQIFLGEFSSKEDAIRARKEGEKKYFNSVLEENQKS